MNFVDIAKQRFSVRSYINKEIPQEKLDLILEAAHVAPTAANQQPVKLPVVKSARSKEKLSKAANIYNAPIAIIVCSDSTQAWTRPFDGKKTTDIDASIITDHMMLAATEQGLGSVWICYFKPDVVKKEFDFPENLEPINILAIGYTDETTSVNRHDFQRTPIDELVSYL